MYYKGWNWDFGLLFQNKMGLLKLWDYRIGMDQELAWD